MCPPATASGLAAARPAAGGTPAVYPAGNWDPVEVCGLPTRSAPAPPRRARPRPAAAPSIRRPSLHPQRTDPVGEPVGQPLDCGAALTIHNELVVALVQTGGEETRRADPVGSQRPQRIQALHGLRTGQRLHQPWQVLPGHTLPG